MKNWMFTLWQRWYSPVGLVLLMAALKKKEEGR